MSERPANYFLCLVAGLMGCHSANQQPVNQVSSSEVALSDIDPKAWNVSIDTKWWICSEKLPEPKFTHGNVGMAIGIPDLLRFDRTQQKCNLKTVDVIPEVAGQRVYQGEHCEISFPSESDEELMIYMRYAERNARNVEHCQYRFALWAIGKGDVADLPDEKLFVPREQTVWKGFDYFPEDILKVELND